MVNHLYKKKDETLTQQLSAKRIEYDINNVEVNMFGEATIKLQDGEVKGETIFYNIKTGSLQAKSAPGERIFVEYNK